MEKRKLAHNQGLPHVTRHDKWRVAKIFRFRMLVYRVKISSIVVGPCGVVVSRFAFRSWDTVSGSTSHNIHSRSSPAFSKLRIGTSIEQRFPAVVNSASYPREKTNEQWRID